MMSQKATMRFRQHGGGTVWDWPVIKLPPTFVALRAHLRHVHADWLAHMPDLAGIEVKPYIEGHTVADRRIGWNDTLLVVLPGYGVLGYVDRMPAPLKAL